MKFHRVTLRSVNRDRPMSGENAEILMDGKPLMGVVSVSIGLRVGGLAVVKLEMSADAEFDGIPGAVEVEKET